MSKGKQQFHAKKESNNFKNSFVPSENQPSNDFVSRNEQMMSHEQSQQANNRPKIKQQTPKKDKSDHISSNQAKGPVKKGKNIPRLHPKMNQIHQQHINIKSNSPPKPKIKKIASRILSPQAQQQYISPKKHMPNLEVQVLQNDQDDEQVVEEQRKIKNLNAGMQKLSESLVDLREKYQQFQKVQSKIQPKSPKQIKSKQKLKSMIFGQKSQEQAERQYKEYLKQKQKQKEARRKVLEQIAEKDKIKHQEWNKQQQQLKERQKRQRLNEIKALHGKFSQQNKKKMEGDEQRKKAVQQFLKKYKQKQSFVERKKKQDEQKHKQKLEQRKQHIMERKEIFKPIDFQEIDQHQKWYYGKSQELINKKREMKQQELKKIQQQNQQFPQFYRGKGHQIHLQQRLEKARKKKVPIQRVKRINDYHQYVRQKFVPRTYQNRSMQLSKVSKDSSLTHRQIKRYRYYKGVSYGQILETRPIAKSYEQIRRIGHHNFQLMKKIPKKRDRIDAYEIKLLEERQNLRYGLGKRQEHYIDPNKIVKDTKIVLPQEVKSDQLIMVMKRLKSHDQHLKHKQYALNSQPQIFSQQIDQTKINEQMIDNIQRKISLLGQL